MQGIFLGYLCWYHRADMYRFLVSVLNYLKSLPSEESSLLERLIRLILQKHLQQLWDILV
jgi:hypothetical protein